MPQLFKIVDLQTGPRENEMMNRYWFDNPSGDNATALNVALEFFDQHVEAVRLVQSDEYDHKAIYVENVLNPAQSALVTIIGGIGAVQRVPVPASNAWSYALKPVGPGIKRGGKRIPGVAEEWTTDEVVATGTPQTVVEALAAFFLAPLQVGPVTLTPAIVRPNQPTNPTEWLVSAMAASIYRQVGTQVSRKLSRGGGTSVGSLIGYTTGDKTAIDRTGLLEANIPAEIASMAAALPAPVTPYEVTRS